MLRRTTQHTRRSIRAQLLCVARIPARRVSNPGDLISSWSGSNDFEKARPGLWLMQHGSTAWLVYVKAPVSLCIPVMIVHRSNAQSLIRGQKKNPRPSRIFWDGKAVKWSFWLRDVTVTFTGRARSLLTHSRLCEHPAGLFLCCCCSSLLSPLPLSSYFSCHYSPRISLLSLMRLRLRSSIVLCCVFAHH